MRAVLTGARSLASARRVLPRQAARPAARTLSSTAEPVPDDDKPPSAPAVPPEDTPPVDAPPPELPRAKQRIPARVAQALASSGTPDKDAAAAAMGQNRDILWIPSDPVAVEDDALPPKEIYNEALSHLLITLSVRTQRRAAFQTETNQSLVEPTLGLYCPLEGGEYVIDNTVRLLARQVDADVVVVDCAQLAAGEWGVFGKEAECIQLSRNPLHFSENSGSTRNSSFPPEEEEDGEEDAPEMTPPLILSAQTIAVPNPRAAASRRTTPLTRSRMFFDHIVGATRPEERYSLGRPRIIYVRDFGLLASQSSSWMPTLVEAVRERRRKPGAKVMTANPTTIVLGLTPALGSSGSPSAVYTPDSIPGPPVSDMARTLRMLTLRAGSKAQTADDSRNSSRPVDAWGESDEADKFREKRNRSRLKRWEDPDFDLASALPAFSMTVDDADDKGSSPVTAMRDTLSIFRRLMGRDRNTQSDDSSRYYRASVIVPSARSFVREKECRVARRKEVNELLMRMGIGHIGGVLDELQHPVALPAIAAPAASAEALSDVETTAAPADAETTVLAESEGAAVAESEAAESTTSPEPAAEVVVAAAPPLPDAELVAEADMLEEWGRRVEPWSAVKEIADRALGTVVASQLSKPAKIVDPIHVPWHAVRESWLAQRSSHHTRKSWIKQAGIADDEAESKTEDGPDEVDEVVERIKRERDLNVHEQRLLGCIVDTPSMPTSFNEVHLPTHTIDSVRTLVSLPLLHPAAFATGVLKQHTMTGALLFGPPGTGKTLLVRALARESGARMMIVKPSDVYDMYVGEGEKLVRAVFSVARKLSPCVVFLDEIDALFGARASGRGTGATASHRGVITEFMQEMDGLKTNEDANVIVIGATNRPFDLDDAVLRRLPRRLLVDLPGEPEREEILKIMLRDERLESDVDIKALAKRTQSFSGSDLKHLCVAAALDAVKETVKLPWSTERKLLPAPAGLEADAGAVSVSSAAPTETAQPVDEVMTEIATAETSDSGVPATATAAVPVEESPETPAAGVIKPRVLGARHFAKALREISPSASETMGTLAELRKWNEEFGENGRAKKRMWGGSFGFMPQDAAHAPQPPPAEGPRI